MPNDYVTIDSLTPVNVPISAKYSRSLAYIFTKDRMPVILTRVIDQLCRDKIIIAEKYGENSAAELKNIIGMLSKLKSDLQTNKKLTPLNASTKDADNWNRLLSLEKEKLGGRDPTWFECSFLFADCYFYRRLIEMFELSKTLSAFDPYLKQKDEALMGSMDSIASLSKYCNVINSKIPKMSESAIKKETIRMLQVALWGNQCDLALPNEGVGNKAEEAIAQVVEKHNSIIVNDSEQVWGVLKEAREAAYDDGSKVLVDIIMDNAGYELITDLCMADFFSSSGLVDLVRFHVKNMPWFVSDTHSRDILWTLSVFELTESKDILTMLSRWKSHFSSGKWKVEENETYWTLPLAFNEMPVEDPELYAKLRTSCLLILKGDLNYRKLIGDINWNYTTEFSKALRHFTPAPLVALRTIKSDVLAGVPPKIATEYKKKDLEWMLHGNYAVVQCYVP